jgi:hypothetical protein
MNPRAWLPVAALFAATPASAMWGGSGTVLNASTGAAMADVSVTLECNKARLIHGWDTIKNVTTVTDKDGKFSFPLSDVWRCDFAFVRPAKEGFGNTAMLDSRYADTRYEEIPGRLYLTPAGDEGLQRLKYFAAFAKGRSSDPKAQYRSLYGDFTSSVAIAKTEREIRFVKDTFCAGLIEADAQLTPAQRDELRRMQGGFPPQPIDHQRFVRPYCSGG